MFFRSAGGNAKAFTAPIAGSFTSSTVFAASAALPAGVAAGDLVIAGSEYRTISSISGQNITIDSAFSDFSNITNLIIGSSESLPNISGNVSPVRAILISGSGTGVFSNCSYASGSPAYCPPYSESGNRDTINFNAALSSSVYKNGAHVQPNTLTIRHYLRIA